MKNLIRITFILALLFTFSSFQITPKHEKNVKKEIKTIFNSEKFLLEEIKVPGNINVKLPVKISNSNFHKIIINNKLVGYVFLETAPSKTAEFDYMILFNADGVILKSKVLIYREEYGGEIGSTRWQKQFVGKSVNDNLDYKKNIDAISGATISVKSMINSVNEVLQTVKILKENKII